MIEFNILEEGSQLYVEAYQTGSAGYLAFYLATVPESQPDTITIDDAWDTYVGFFLLLQEEPDSLDTFEDLIATYLDTNYADPEHTGFAWVEYDNDDPDELGTVSVIAAASDGDGGAEVAADVIIYFRNYGIPFGAEAPIITTTEDSSITGFIFEYPPFDDAPDPVEDYNIQLPFTGDDRLTLQGQLSMADLSDDADTGWNVTMNYVINDEGTDVLQTYPLFDVPDGVQVFFDFILDPVDQLNEARSYFAFAGYAFQLEEDGEEWSVQPVDSIGLQTFWRTIYGETISLIPLPNTDQPAKLFFDNLYVESGEDEQYYLTPDGDFEFYIEDNTSASTYQLIAGLSGAESFSFTPYTDSSSGNILRFDAKQNAYAPTFPLIDTSGNSIAVSNSRRKRNVKMPLLSAAKAVRATSELLTSDYTTSYINVHASADAATGASVPVYYSQPNDAALYDHQSVDIDVVDELLLLRDTAAAYFSDGVTQSFPMVPYAGVVSDSGLSDSDLQLFEDQILTPQRRTLIASIPEEDQLQGVTVSDTMVQTTTPQGLIATVPESGLNWDSVILAKSTSNGVDYELSFSDTVSSDMRNALQSNQLFLVITDSTNIGTFNNEITIADWPFTINIGKEQSTVLDYSNVLIFKFCSGTIIDRAKDTQTWNSPDTFNDDASLVSVYLQNFINNTLINADSDEAYQNFVDIIQDENWNGILALQVDVSVQNFPDDLKGLLAGIDQSEFYAHHLGIEINYVEPSNGELTLPKSSLFGLIDYVDKGSGSTEDIALHHATDPFILNTVIAKSPITDTNSDGLYDFSVYMMQVIFENTDIKNFTSKVELTVTSWFGETAVLQVDNYGDSLQQQTLEFNGSYEKHNGVNTYAFVTDPDNAYQFIMNGAAIQYVEIVKAQFSTISNTDSTTISDTGSNIEQVNAQFTFVGYLNFNLIDGFDALSFGDEAGEFSTTKGLYFSGLAVNMSFELDDDTGDVSDPTYAFNMDSISFDSSLSSPRENSLYSKFPITLSGITGYTSTNGSLSELGFLSVDITTPVDIDNNDMDDSNWYGLVYDINLGSMGALASYSGFTAQLIVAWSPGDDLQLSVGILLPGVGGGQKTLSLQTVLNISISSFELIAFYTDGTAAQDLSYILKLDDIKLKILGKKLPGSSDTEFILFGDSTGADTSTLAWYAAYFNTKSEKSLKEV